MKLALAAVVVLVVLAWWRWPDVSLPAFGSRHSGAASATPDDDDDPVEESEQRSPPPPPKIPSSERRTLVPTYDPWAGPPPFDPHAPRLPDLPEESQPGSRRGRGAMRELHSAIADCYAAQTPIPREPLTVMVGLEPEASDGGPTETIDLRDAHGERFPDAFDACVKDAVAGITFPFLDETHRLRLKMTVFPPLN